MVNRNSPHLNPLPEVCEEREQLPSPFEIPMALAAPTDCGQFSLSLGERAGVRGIGNPTPLTNQSLLQKRATVETRNPRAEILNRMARTKLGGVLNRGLRRLHG
jgi:hypothetical protein